MGALCKIWLWAGCALGGGLWVMLGRFAFSWGDSPGVVGGAAVGLILWSFVFFCDLVFCCYTGRFHRLLVILWLSFSIKCMLGLVDNDLYQVIGYCHVAAA